MSATQTMTETEKKQQAEAVITLTKQVKKQLGKLETQKKDLKELIEIGIDEFHAHGEASRAHTEGQVLTLVTLMGHIEKLNDKLWTKKWLYKRLGVSRNWAQKQMDDFKDNVKSSGLTEEAYIEQMHQKMIKGEQLFVKRKQAHIKRAKAVMSKTEDTMVEADVREYQLEKIEKKEKKDVSNNRDDKVRDEAIERLENMIKFLKKITKEDKYKKLKTVSFELERQINKLVEKAESGLPFETETPSTEEMDNLRGKYGVPESNSETAIINEIENSLNDIRIENESEKESKKE